MLIFSYAIFQELELTTSFYDSKIIVIENLDDKTGKHAVLKNMTMNDDPAIIKH